MPAPACVLRLSVRARCVWVRLRWIGGRRCFARCSSMFKKKMVSKIRNIIINQSNAYVVLVAAVYCLLSLDSLHMWWLSTAMLSRRLVIFWITCSFFLVSSLKLLQPTTDNIINNVLFFRRYARCARSHLFCCETPVICPTVSITVYLFWSHENNNRKIAANLN